MGLTFPCCPQCRQALDCAEAEVSEGNFNDVFGDVLGYCAELFFVFFFWFLLTECSSQLPGLRLSGKTHAGDKDLWADSPWHISNAERERSVS